MHFTFTSNTGNNAQMAIPLSANPNVDGVPLDPGDEIGAFSPGGLCVGAVAWDAVNNVVLCIWGDNDITPTIDGMRDGEWISLKIWRKVTDTEHSCDSLSFRSDPPFEFQPRYHIDALYGVLSFSAPLPIELDYFKADVRDNQVLLTWRTISETNCFGFWIRRQFEGGEWIDRDLIQGHGTTLVPQDYSFIDSPSQAGRYSYQLVEVDLDGSRHDHETISIELAPISSSVTSATKSNVLLIMGGIALAIIIVWLLLQFVV
jgi:hypothetical protein